MWISEVRSKAIEEAKTAAGLQLGKVLDVALLKRASFNFNQTVAIFDFIEPGVDLAFFTTRAECYAASKTWLIRTAFVEEGAPVSCELHRLDRDAAVSRITVDGLRVTDDFQADFKDVISVSVEMQKRAQGGAPLTLTASSQEHRFELFRFLQFISPNVTPTSQNAITG